MKYETVTGQNAVVIRPETVEECGLFLWLVHRFKGRRVRIEVDTTMLNGNPNEMMMWIIPQEEK